MTAPFHCRNRAACLLCPIIGPCFCSCKSCRLYSRQVDAPAHAELMAAVAAARDASLSPPVCVPRSAAPVLRVIQGGKKP